MSHSHDGIDTVIPSFQFNPTHDDLSEDYEQRHRIETSIPEFRIFDCRVDFVPGRTKSFDKTMMTVTQTIPMEIGVKLVQYTLDPTDCLIRDEKEESGYRIVKG